MTPLSEVNRPWRHILAKAAVTTIMLSAALSMVVANNNNNNQRHWTICHSNLNDNGYPPMKVALEKEDANHKLNNNNNNNIVPPSSWDEETHHKHCFLHRNDTSSAPGTALFQHWLSDYTNSSSDDGNHWDPWNDFPTWENVMRHYSDIGEGNGTARDYYTLWYTTVVRLPEVESVVSSRSSSVVDDAFAKRGHLTLHGVNYRPIVYLDGRLIQPYSTVPIDNDNDRSSENAGGMFLRRHYNLGLSANTTQFEQHQSSSSSSLSSSSSTLSLDILVLPPPTVGLPLPNQQGGDHNLAQSGPIMQFTAGWDWISSTPDRNTGIWAADGVEVEWIRGDVRLHDSYVRVVNVTNVVDDDNVGEVDGEQTEDLWGEQYGGLDSADGAEGLEVLPLGDDVVVAAWLELSVTATYHAIGEQYDGRKIPIRGMFEYSIVPSSSSSSSSSSLSSRVASPSTEILASGTIHNITIQESATDIDLGKVLLPAAKLWWPHTHSTRHRQPLYSVHVTFRSYDDTTNSHEKESYAKTDTPHHHRHHHRHEARTQSTFGIRTISSFTHPRTKSFALRINGHPVFLTGGVWITTDQFLRHSNTPSRYLKELSLLRHAGFNSVRVWGGGIAETSHFYDAADVLGMVVYQEFWMTGDNNGRWGGSYDWPTGDRRGGYLVNARDTIKRLRGHPSLCWYGGGNELYVEEKEDDGGVSGDEESVVSSPPRDIDEGLRKYIAELDGTRPYITSSMTSIGNTFDSSRSLSPKDGPYGMLSEEMFFDRNPGYSTPLLSRDEIKRNMTPSDVPEDEKDSPGRNIGFQTEVGSASHPELESLKRFLSRDALSAYPACGEKPASDDGSIHEEWTYFKYQSFAENTSDVDHICQFKFPPYGYNSTTEQHQQRPRMDSIEDYSWAAQFAQYLQYKSLVEGYTHRMWEWYSAVFLWKTSSPAPTFRGALYDWYLATNGGYWGARAGLAGGSPVKLVLNLRDWTVHAINTVPTTLAAASVEWKAYSLDGVLLANGAIPIPQERIGGNSVVHLEGSLPWAADESESFVPNPHGVQDIIVYRLDLSYSQHDDLGTPGTAKNTYYLTDPSITSDDHAHSRYALLGAMRKEAQRVNLEARYQISTSGIECTLQNAQDNSVAVMVKLALVKSSQEGDPRILPTLLSDNYMTLLPGETSRVHLSMESVELLEQSTQWSCSPDGFVKILGSTNDVNLMLSIDGWNIQKSEVQISCVGPSSGTSSTKVTPMDTSPEINIAVS